jgi:steroid delta-isomerase-like uncharacterized protein
MGTDNATLARRFITEVWGKGNEAAIDELVDPDIVFKDTMGTDMRGIPKIKEMVGMMKKSFEDNTFTIDEVIVAGDRAIVRATWQGMHRGEFFGVPGTGRTISSQCIDILRIKNGKVVEDLGFVDSYGMFQQMGVLPERDKLYASRARASAQPAQART